MGEVLIVLVDQGIILEYTAILSLYIFAIKPVVPFPHNQTNCVSLCHHSAVNEGLNSTEPHMSLDMDRTGF